MAMILYPEVQAKAQMEVDALLGGSRLPEFEDQASLPYVCCIIKEVLRWKSVLPLGESGYTSSKLCYFYHEVS